MDTDITMKLSRAITTASNDDYSEPGTEKRDRHCQRIMAMREAIDEIERLRDAINDRERTAG